MSRLLCLALLLTGLLLAALCLGASPVAPGRVLEMILMRDAQDFVIWNHRLPRSLVALMVGASLGLSGALVQGVIRNPLASPDLLGVTQGAGLALSAGLLLVPGLAPGWLPGLAVAGGAAGAGLLMAYNAGGFAPLRFALSGVAISACFAGVTEFLLLTHPVEINTALMSLTGSLWARGWEQAPLCAALLPLMALTGWLAKPLDLMALGPLAARGLGLRLGAVTFAALALAVGLASLAVAIAGPVGFVGLVAPHLARRLLGGRHRRLLPGAALIGAAIVLAADLLGRAVAPPAEIPVGVLTAVIGAPYFLWLLFRIR